MSATDPADYIEALLARPIPEVHPDQISLFDGIWADGYGQGYEAGYNDGTNENR